tara:strand:- start:2253 stop:2426 length:174 start_codon:yes stop_codon:yes gene_type:complete
MGGIPTAGSGVLHRLKSGGGVRLASGFIQQSFTAGARVIGRPRVGGYAGCLSGYGEK